MRHTCLIGFLLLASAAMAHAQRFSTSACNSGSNSDSDSSWFGHQDRACELRSTTLPADGPTRVAGANGGIEVLGEDRRDIALEARVEAQAGSRSDAEALLHQIEIVTNGEIHADGPHNSGWLHNSSWSVSYKLRVPRRLAVQLTTGNGSIAVTQVEGGVDAGTVNGAVHLADVGGNVQAHTTNGGIAIALGGNRWHGDGLSARTVNGGITLKAPNSFSAHLMAQTVNGGIDVGFPMTVSETNRHHIDTNIGSGGPALNLQTVNGGISISQGGKAGTDQREE